MKTTVNGTTVEVTEVNGIVTVNVITENATVNINGQSVWATFDKEEYSYIPENLRQFIKDSNPDMGFETSQGGKVVYADCYNKDIRPVATFYFTGKQNEPVNIRFDYIDDLDMLNSEYLQNSSALSEERAQELFKKFKELDNRLRATIEEYGFKWSYSHAAGEMMYAWWDIVVTNENWNEEGFMKCWKIIGEANSLLNATIDEAKLY